MKLIVIVGDCYKISFKETFQNTPLLSHAGNPPGQGEQQGGVKLNSNKISPIRGLFRGRLQRGMVGVQRSQEGRAQCHCHTHCATHIPVNTALLLLLLLLLLTAVEKEVLYNSD